LIGIVLGHWLLHAPFTATSMIGFIALAGIIVRNSILLVDFIRRRRGEGAVLRVALPEAGAIPQIGQRAVCVSRHKGFDLTVFKLKNMARDRANVGAISMNADRGPIRQRVLYLMNIADRWRHRGNIPWNQAHLAARCQTTARAVHIVPRYLGSA
jgi:hypothetical protein